MEMRWIVIVVKHGYDDPLESAYLRHLSCPFYLKRNLISLTGTALYGIGISEIVSKVKHFLMNS